MSGWLDQAKYIIEAIARCVEFAAALIIAVASVEALIKAAVIFVQRNRPASAKNEVRLTLGRWLAVALEFELAADILNTAVTPTCSDIEKLRSRHFGRLSTISWNVKSAKKHLPSKSCRSCGSQ